MTKTPQKARFQGNKSVSFVQDLTHRQGDDKPLNDHLVNFQMRDWEHCFSKEKDHVNDIWFPVLSDLLRTFVINGWTKKLFSS